MKALIVGNVNLDTFVETTDFPSVGENKVCKNIESFFGGKAANQAVAFSKLGGEAIVFAAVGSDEGGRKVISHLREQGVLTSNIEIVPNEKTGHAVVIKIGDNNRILSCPGANNKLTLNKKKLFSLIQNVDVVMLSLGVGKEITEYVIDVARKLNKLSVIDLTPINGSINFPDNWHKCNIVNCNETEAKHFAKIMGGNFSDVEDIGAREAAEFLSKYTNLFVLKKGSKGAEIFKGDFKKDFPVDSVEVIDPTGAGDAFFAAITKEYLDTKDISAAVIFGNRVGRLTCTRKGAQGGPTLRDINKRTLQDAILIVGAGILQIPAIKIAKEMGLYVICTDFDENAPGFEFCNEKIILSTKDVDGHVILAKKLSQLYYLRSVFTQGTDVAITVAEAAKAVGLPAVNVEAARNTNNKVKFRECLEKAGIENIKFKKVQTIEEVYEAVKYVGLPAMIKAVDNSGGRGIKKIISYDEIEQSFETARSFSSDKKTVLVEEWIEGVEQSVETIQYNGRSYRLGVADRIFGFFPYPVETGHINPSMLDNEVQEKLYQITENAAKAVGITFGAAKADTIISKDGGVLILEMAARLSGGFHAQYTTPYATGMNVIKSAIDISLGKDIDERDVTPTKNKFLYSTSPFPFPGKVIEISGVEEVKKMVGVKEVFIIIKKDELINDYQNSTDRVAYVITEGDSFEEAERISIVALEKLRIITEKAEK